MHCTMVRPRHLFILLMPVQDATFLLGKGVEFYNPACRGGREKRRNMFHHNVSLLPPCTTHQSRGLTDAPLACFCAELWSFKLFAYRRAHIYTLKYIDKKQKQTVLALPFPSTFLSYP